MQMTEQKYANPPWDIWAFTPYDLCGAHPIAYGQYSPIAKVYMSDVAFDSAAQAVVTTDGENPCDIKPKRRSSGIYD